MTAKSRSINDTERKSGVLATSGDQALADPVVDYAWSDFQSFRSLCHREFSCLSIIGTSNVVLVTNPFDALDREAISLIRPEPFIVQHC